MIDLASLRREFDAAFAEPPPAPPPDQERLVAIAIAGRRFALPLAELAGIERAVEPTPLPGAPPALLGVACVGGRLVPVFSLARILGLGAFSREGREGVSSSRAGASRAAGSTPLALVRGDEPLGLAFDEFLGAVEVPRAAIIPRSPEGSPQPEGMGEGSPLPGRSHVSGQVHVLGAAALLLSPSSIAAALAASSGACGPAEESRS